MKDTAQSDKGEGTGPQKLPPASRSALRWYFFGFSLLGGAVGYFAGSSQSPVIGTLLPLLFGLVGGAGGLYLTRVDPGKPEVLIRLRILGKALALFIIFTLLGSVYGISLRTERSMWSFLSPKIVRRGSGDQATVSTQDDPKRAIQMAMLRARIRALGVSSDEEREILQQAAKMMLETEYTPVDAASSLRRLEVLCRRADEELTEALYADACANAKGFLKASCQRAEVIKGYLGAYAEDYNVWAEKIEAGESIPVAFVKHRIEGLRATIEKLLHGYEGASPWLSAHDQPRQRIWELQWALIDEGQKLGPAKWMEGGPLIEEVDRFLEIFYGRGAAKTEGSPPWKLPELGHLR